MSDGVHPLAGIIAAFARAISGVQVRGSDGFLMRHGSEFISQIHHEPS
jgi:hypothetical protein